MGEHMSNSGANGLGTRWLVGAAALFGIVSFADPAAAHFTLMEPASWNSQDAFGNPQKLGPCGSEAGGTPTGIVTAYQTGQTITVTIHETIFHPGHYRISLALHDRSELPAEPTVTPGSSTPCGTVPIQNPPVFPVLADGLFVHTAPMSGPQTFQVPLPAGMTCTHCTLQVLEFMSQHPLNNPGGCFYHHCADISIQDVVVSDAGGSIDSGAALIDSGVALLDSGAAMDASTDAATTPPTTRGACACSVPGTRLPSRSPICAALAIALALTLRTRRVRGATSSSQSTR